jgi:hypothetical protein
MPLRWRLQRATGQARVRSYGFGLPLLHFVLAAPLPPVACYGSSPGAFLRVRIIPFALRACFDDMPLRWRLQRAAGQARVRSYGFGLSLLHFVLAAPLPPAACRGSSPGAFLRVRLISFALRACFDDMPLR